MRTDNGLFIFDSRADLLTEITQGQDRNYYAAVQCPTCGFLHVHVFAQRYTPLSDRSNVHVPDSIRLEMTVWEWGPRFLSVEDCRYDGTAMEPVRDEHNARYLDCLPRRVPPEHPHNPWPPRG